MLTIHSPIAKRRRLPLTPLIDVIFILVMFFLLSSSFAVWRSLDVSVSSDAAVDAVEHAAEKTVPSVFMTLEAREGSNAVLVRVNGTEVGLEGLRAELDRLAGAGAQSAVLVPKEGASFQQVVRVLDAARTSRIARVGLQLN